MTQDAGDSGQSGGAIPNGPADYRRQRELASRVKRSWQEDESPDAAAFLAQHPAISRYSSLAVELAFEEYWIRRERGEQIDIAAFCARFPAIRPSLMKQVECDEYVRRELPSPISQDDLAYPELGDLLFDCRVEEEIGRGGFSRVYLCSQDDLGGRHAVVKVTDQGLPEADILGRLNHPNIIEVHAVHDDPELQLSCIRMPFVGRSTLLDLIQMAFQGEQLPRQATPIFEAARRRIQPGDRCQTIVPPVRIPVNASYVTGVVLLSLQIADALHHAHQRGVLHGDVKPSNVVLSVEGTPLLVDFNLAFGRPDFSNRCGWTPPYVAPEQLRAFLLGMNPTERVDERADLFAFGSVLYELLTGQTPFEVDLQEPDPDRHALAGCLLDAQAASVRPVRLLNPEVDPALAELVEDCLQFDPDMRPASMADVAERLRGQPSPLMRTWRVARRHRTLSLTILVAFVLLSMAVAFTVVMQPSQRERQYKLGTALFQQGQLREAVHAFSNSVASDGSFAEAYLGRAAATVQLFERDGSPELLDAAIRDLRFAARLRNDPRIQSAKAFCFIRKYQIKVATDVLEKAIEDGLESVEVWNNLGYCQSLLTSECKYEGRYEEAAQRAATSLKRAISLEPLAWQPHLNLSILELERFRVTKRQHVPREGLKAIRRVIQLHPQDAGTFFFAAKLAGIIGEIDKSPTLLEECLDYLEQACDRGHNLPRHGVALGHPFQQLEGSPRFQALLQREPSSKPRTAGQRAIVPAVLTTLRVTAEQDGS